MRLTRRELATVLAALRYWQTIGGANMPEVVAVQDIATDGGKLIPLYNTEIDRLCEKLNLGR